jgi:hypothetical protein
MRRHITPALMSAILDAGYNIDYIDAVTIDKLGTIPYPVLIIPPTDRIPLSAYKKVESYAAKGKVIAIEKLPSLGPGLKQQDTSAEIAALSGRLFKDADHKGIFINSAADLADTLHHALPPDFDAAGQVSNVGFIHRKLADSDIYFVVNSNNQPADGTIRFRSSRSAVEAWDSDSGGVLETFKLADGVRIPLKLAPYESRIFVLRDKPEAMDESARQAESSNANEARLADLSTDWQLHFANETASRDLGKLTSWTDIPGKQNYSGEAVYSRSVTISHAPAGGNRISIDFGTGTAVVDKRRPMASGTLALLDPPIREAAEVFVNGQRVGSLWHPPYRIDISKFVHSGENKVEVHVYNTAINLLAGQPPRDYTALRAKYGHSFDPQDMNNLQSIPSGLLGTIQLIEEGGK